MRYVLPCDLGGRHHVLLGLHQCPGSRSLALGGQFHFLVFQKMAVRPVALARCHWRKCAVWKCQSQQAHVQCMPSISKSLWTPNEPTASSNSEEWGDKDLALKLPTLTKGRDQKGKKSNVYARALMYLWPLCSRTRNASENIWPPKEGPDSCSSECWLFPIPLPALDLEWDPFKVKTFVPSPTGRCGGMYLSPSLVY